MVFRTSERLSEDPCSSEHANNMIENRNRVQALSADPNRWRHGSESLAATDDGGQPEGL